MLSCLKTKKEIVIFNMVIITINKYIHIKKNQPPPSFMIFGDFESNLKDVEKPNRDNADVS